MLIRFLVGNYKSFNTIQEFSMIAGKTRTRADHIIDQNNLKLLRLGVIFGANASGKSNLINAIYFAKDIILNNTQNMDNDMYHKLSDGNQGKPSYFEFEIKINEKFYTYGFEIIINRKEIVSEWLYEISLYSEKLIFNRDLIEDKFELGLKNLSNEIKQKLDVYQDDIKKNNKVLFLNEMNRNKKELYKKESEINIFNHVYKWFILTLDVNYPDEPITDYTYLRTDNKDEILDIIKCFGTGISDFKIIDSSLDEISKKFPGKLLEKINKDINKFISLNQDENKSGDIVRGITIRGNDSMYMITVDNKNIINVNTIVFEHEVKNKIFKFSDESDGTKRILDLIEILLPNENDRVYIIDEFDRSLHPQLTYKFIDMFSKFPNNNRQLIITTHESRLLDFEVLRRDEIWFIEKKRGSSELYSLEAFNERFDKKIDKAYLDGRYGGVPIFTSIFPVKE